MIANTSITIKKNPSISSKHELMEMKNIVKITSQNKLEANKFFLELILSPFIKIVIRYAITAIRMMIRIESGIHVILFFYLHL